MLIRYLWINWPIHTYGLVYDSSMLMLWEWYGCWLVATISVEKSRRKQRLIFIRNPDKLTKGLMANATHTFTWVLAFSLIKNPLQQRIYYISQSQGTRPCQNALILGAVSQVVGPLVARQQGRTHPELQRYRPQGSTQCLMNLNQSYTECHKKLITFSEPLA